MIPEALTNLIILSPHLDDAVLSCGGMIAQTTAAGGRVLVVTITAGDPPQGETSAYARSLESRWQLQQEAVANRRAEDIAACQVLGADWRHWDVPDCIYRRDPQTGETFYNSNEEIFGAVAPADQPLLADLVGRLADLPAAAQLVVPLSIGHHVDHQLTRLAAERLNRPLIYYEDYPYAGRPDALHEVLPPPAAGWHSRSIPISPAALEKKVAAILCYRSQISTFFADEQDLREKLSIYSTRVGGERLWMRVDTP